MILIHIHLQNAFKHVVLEQLITTCILILTLKGAAIHTTIRIRQVSARMECIQRKNFAHVSNVPMTVMMVVLFGIECQQHAYKIVNIIITHMSQHMVCFVSKLARHIAVLYITLIIKKFVQINVQLVNICIQLIIQI